jgi:hypothetical protein
MKRSSEKLASRDRRYQRSEVSAGEDIFFVLKRISKKQETLFWCATVRSVGLINEIRHSGADGNLRLVNEFEVT